MTRMWIQWMNGMEFSLLLTMKLVSFWVYLVEIIVVLSYGSLDIRRWVLCRESVKDEARTL